MKFFFIAMRNIGKHLSPCPGPCAALPAPRSAAITQHVAVSVCRWGPAASPKELRTAAFP